MILADSPKGLLDASTAAGMRVWHSDVQEAGFCVTVACANALFC